MLISSGLSIEAICLCQIPVCLESSRGNVEPFRFVFESLVKMDTDTIKKPLASGISREVKVKSRNLQAVAAA